ncbi:MAG: hypothetical protein R2769_10940 [Saprospiraceae bacterium]
MVKLQNRSTYASCFDDEFSQGFILMKLTPSKLWRWCVTIEKKPDIRFISVWMQGPNVHLLYPADIIHEVRSFVESQLVPLCEGNK